MKICTKCNKEKELTEFHKLKTGKEGRRPDCKSCFSEYNKANKEKIAEYQKAYYKANKEEISQEKKARYKANREEIRQYYKANKERISEYNKQWKIDNQDKVNTYAAKRRAVKLKATPKWLTEYQHKQIELKYWISNFLSEYTGVEHHVDHIHPLQGENICGLHVPENLQILTAEENMKKGNRTK